MAEYKVWDRIRFVYEYAHGDEPDCAFFYAAEGSEWYIDAINDQGQIRINDGDRFYGEWVDADLWMIEKIEDTQTEDQ